MRAVIELKRDVDPEKRWPSLQILPPSDHLRRQHRGHRRRKAVQMGLKEVIGHFIRHQKDVVTRRTRYELEQAKARAHILEGLIIAVDNLDEVIRLNPRVFHPKEARERPDEALRPDRNPGPGDPGHAAPAADEPGDRVSLRREYEEIRKLIDRLTGILSSEKKLLGVIKQELTEIRSKYADPRRTALIDRPEEVKTFEEEKPVAEEAVVVVTRAGFVKRLTPKAFERRCGGQTTRMLLRT
jgi:DNA gyrase/topoisomerase IV subunit A